MRRLWLSFALLGGCGGEVCESLAPARPSVLEPATGHIDVVGDSLKIVASAYSEPEGEAHQISEMEIWRLDGGEREELVWTATLEAPADLTQAMLVDGSYQGSALVLGGLDQWTEYAVRVRYRDACAWSEWSDDRSFRTDDGSTYLFEPGVVRVIELDIPPSSLASIDAQAVGPWPYVPDRDYYTGTLHFEGQQFDGVGVRVKGGCGSSRNVTGKAALKISLSWDDPAVAGCPEARRLYGQTHLTLNNMVQDPSFERERLGYRLYRAFGVAAPRTAHVRLRVNGQDWGLYLHVESFDRRFLARWFPSNDGMMYEGGPFCDLVPEQIPPGPGEDCFDQEFSTGACDTPSPGQDPTDWELLRQLAAQIASLPDGGFYPEVDAFFDFDQFLSSFAITALISDWDGYQYGNINNYRVYHDPSTGRWSLIQSGIDNSFDSSPGFDFWSVAAVLATRCFAEPDCTAAFAAKMHAAADLMESLDLVGEAEIIQAQIRADIISDPRKEVSSDAALAAHQSLVGWIPGRPAAVRASLASRGF